MTGPVLHATTIAIHRHGEWRAVLLRGPSGAGKSSLALRAMTEGWRLVADDRTLVWRSGDGLFGRAPATLAGLVEARGVGVAPVGHLAWARIALVVDLTELAAIERMPEPAVVEIGGTFTPSIALWAHDAAAPAKVAIAVDRAFACPATSLGLPPRQAYQAPHAEGPESAAADGGLIMRIR